MKAETRHQTKAPVAVLIVLVLPASGTIVAWPAHVGMQYIITVVTWFGQQSWASIDVQIPLWSAIAAYGTLVYAIYCKSPLFLYGQNRASANGKI